MDVLDKNHFNFNILQVEDCGTHEDANYKKRKKTIKTKMTSNKIRQNVLQMDKCDAPQTAETLFESNANKCIPTKTNSSKNQNSLSEFRINASYSENGAHSQENSYCSIDEVFETENSEDEIPYIIEFETNGSETGQTVEVYGVDDSNSEKFEKEVAIDSETTPFAEQLPESVAIHEVIESFADNAVLHPDNLQKVNTPFKASKQLPRTPGERNKRLSLKFQSKLKKHKKSFSQNEVKVSYDILNCFMIMLSSIAYSLTL